MSTDETDADEGNDLYRLAAEGEAAVLEDREGFSAGCFALAEALC